MEDFFEFNNTSSVKIKPILYNDSKEYYKEPQDDAYGFWFYTDDLDD